jgi:hypothetical protein
MTANQQTFLNLAYYLRRRAGFHLSSGNTQRAAELEISAAEYERQAGEAV